MPVKQNFQYIHVAVDFSPASEAAWKQAAWLARNPGVSPTLLHSLADSSALVHSNSVLDALCDQASSDVKLREKSDKKLRRIVSESNLKDSYRRSRRWSSYSL
jgi:Universal stress protein family